MPVYRGFRSVTKSYPVLLSINFVNRRVTVGTLDKIDGVKAIGLVVISFTMGDNLVIGRSQSPTPLISRRDNLEIHYEYSFA